MQLNHNAELTLTVGASGDTVTLRLLVLAQTGFGRTGTVDWEHS